MSLFFATPFNSSLSSFVPNFRMLTQVVAEKSLTEKNVHMYYIRFLFVFVALRPKSTAMVMVGRSVYLITLLPGQV